MSVNPLYAQLIADLGQTLGMAGLAPTHDGICQLVFDGQHVVQLVYVPAADSVLLSCRLADHGIDADQAHRMARANFMQAGRGTVLCVAPDGRPYMQAALPLGGCTAGQLCSMLESLLDQAESWASARVCTPAARDTDPAIYLQSV